MIYHKIYNSWAWVGGHCDGDSDTLYVAIKEAKEETGIKKVSPIFKDIYSLEVLTVDGHEKRGKEVSSEDWIKNRVYAKIIDRMKKDGVIK